MWRKWLTVLAVVTFLLAGCNKESHMELEEDAVEERGEEEIAVHHFPLTGIQSEEEADGRAVAVVINNHPEARPQSGLHQADLIYEVLAEGNVTRFLAIFQSEKPNHIGPVRSARDYFIELAKGYDSFFVAHGYSPDAYDLLRSGYIDHINGMQYDGSLFKRESFRQVPHNSYITYDHIIKGAEQKGYDMKEKPDSLFFLTRGELDVLDGEPAGAISISYHDASFNSSFTYDDSLQKYKRYLNGVQSVDYETKDPILIDNIFVVETQHDIIDKEGRRNIDLTSGGRGYLFQKGKKLDVDWRNLDGRILPYSSGEMVGFVPGKTWINVISDYPGLDQDIEFQ